MQRRNLLKSIGIGMGAIAIPENSIFAEKKTSKKVLRIAHLTDIHAYNQPVAIKGFEKCLHHIQNLADKVDMIINGGDAIMEAHGQSKSATKGQFDIYNSIIKNQCNLPIISCIGNHDIWCEMPTAESFEDGKKCAMDELMLEKKYYSVSQNGWKIIVLDSIQPKPDGSWYTAYLDSEQYNWLDMELKNTSFNTSILIVSHVPILAACVFYDGKRFENSSWNVSGAWMHADSSKISDLFYKYPNVKLAVSGHIHLQDKVEYNNLTYCCNGAVSGNWWMGKYHQTEPGYAIIDLFSDGTVQNTYVKYKI